MAAPSRSRLRAARKSGKKHHGGSAARWRHAPVSLQGNGAYSPEDAPFRSSCAYRFLRSEVHEESIGGTDARHGTSTEVDGPPEEARDDRVPAPVHRDAEPPIRTTRAELLRPDIASGR